MTEQPHVFMRTSEWKDLNRCPQKWDFAWNQGLQSRGAPADPLWFGTGIHIALAEWYCGPGTKRGRHPAEVWEEYAGDSIVHMKTLIPADTEEGVVASWEDAKLLGIAMMEGYIGLYGADEHKLIINPEQKFRFSLPWGGKFAGDKNGKEFTLVEWLGTFDSAWRHADTGWAILDEHKTAQVIRVGHLTLDIQGGGYWAVAGRTLRNQGLLKPNEQLRGIQYNFMRKAMPDIRPRNGDGYICNKPVKKNFIEALHAKGFDQVTEKWTLKAMDELATANRVIVYGDVSKQQGSPLFLRHDVHKTSKERVAVLLGAQGAARRMASYRSGLMPVTTSPDWSCERFCDYFELCELTQASGGDQTSGSVEEYKRLRFDVVDRYADHRKSTDE